MDLSDITMISDFDPTKIWLELKKPYSDVAYLETVPPIGKSWHEAITVFGNLESNELSVWCKGGIIIEISMRIDFQTNFVALIERLLYFFKSQDLCLLDENVRFVEMNLETIIDVIEKHPQRKRYEELRSDK